MYTVPVLNGQVLTDYANTYSAKLLPIIQNYLNGATKTVSVTNRGSVVVGVQKNTPTYRILSKLSDIAYLQTYLLWNVNQQYAFIKILSGLKKYPSLYIFKKLTAKVYDNENLGAATHPFDHFNTIFHDIFVDQIYDSDAKPSPFDKFDFIAKTQLRVCPYCGMEFIQPSGKTKKQIDHFFPKNRYPFLALSYFNLIPSCDTCNESPNKGQRDPIEQLTLGNKIQHPYMMNGNIVRFNVGMKVANIFEDANFEVVVGFKEKALLDGYNLFFDISERYKSHNVEAGNIFRSQYKYKKAKGYYAGMPIDKAWIDEAYDNLFNFAPENNNPWSQEFFKMKVDMFEQLFGVRAPEPYYTKRMAPNTEILE